ncbi:hypothetical protein CK503_03970 [Aliifodinibius salipaludis]|uniref:Outer membrane lipoprotein BamD-like domain-containing protein n=1 Tax=Fodinibius salipaludis TaxID=2032627 RepID=A0A2A2GDU1_9BACT|nr:hypothetical protein [Aliifodinibius salipaludis]PAU95360.1 hypothetical protein CK503_03970 [Aliifodinibius salipaludis]
MNNPETTILFLITGLITACGSHEAMPILQKARMKVVNKQYLEAIFTAEKIVEHYPGTAFEESARKIIYLINKHHLDEEYTVTV